MENSAKNKIKDKIGKVTSLFLLLTLLTAFGVSFYYNETLQKQVNERDNLIYKLTQRDSILNKIMDIEYDSISETTSYSYLTRDGKVLKYNELVSELEQSRNNYNQISERHNRITNDYINRDTLSIFLDSLNLEHNGLIIQYNELIEKYNSSIENRIELTKKYFQVLDSLSSFKSIVDLTQSKYSIDYNIRKNGNYKEISIKADKIDSALILLPYFRDRLKLDNEKKVWIINTGKN